MDNALLPGFGGPMGKYAVRRGPWFNALLAALVAATCCFFFLVTRHIPCLQTDPANPINSYIRVCYSDIQASFLANGFGQGASPVASPVLTQSPLIEVLSALILAGLLAFGFTIGPAATQQQIIDASVVFFATWVVMLFLCFLAAVVAGYIIARHARGDDGWGSLVLATSPIILASGLIDWTLLPWSLTLLALAQLVQEREIEAGVLLAIAACAGTMPIGIASAIVAALVLRRETKAALRIGTTFCATFLVVQLPLLIGNFNAVYGYYHHEINKEVSYGSLWYLASQFGLNLRGFGSFTFTVMLLLALFVILSWLYVTNRRPSIGAMIAVVVLITTVLSATFTPQSALWVLLAVLVARPYKLDVIAVTASQVVYWAAIWGWLGGGLTIAKSGPYLLYWLAILGHVAVQVLVLVNCFIDISQRCFRGALDRAPATPSKTAPRPARGLVEA